MPHLELAPFRSFPDACDAVLRCLQGTIGFAAWLVTRTDGDDWIVLASRDASYGIAPGQVFRWSDSFCSRMVNGAPRVAADVSAVSEYDTAPIGALLAIGSYVGIPLVRNDGTLFGTLCAIDPSKSKRELKQDVPMVETMGRILATMLESDLALQERQREIERERLSAETDELTGLLNRKGWNAALMAEEERARHFGHAAVIGVFDLDDLKKVNDTAGHAEGDALIRRAAQVLRANVEEKDIVARIGGDEFAVLFPETRGEGLQEQFESAFRAENLSVSCGFAVWDRQTTLAALLKAADSAMYTQKRERRRPAG